MCVYIYMYIYCIYIYIYFTRSLPAWENVPRGPNSSRVASISQSADHLEKKENEKEREREENKEKELKPSLHYWIFAIFSMSSRGGSHTGETSGMSVGKTFNANWSRLGPSCRMTESRSTSLLLLQFAQHLHNVVFAKEGVNLSRDARIQRAADIREEKTNGV